MLGTHFLPMTFTEAKPEIHYGIAVARLFLFLLVIVVSSSLYWSFLELYRHRKDASRYIRYPWDPKLEFATCMLLGGLILLGQVAFAWLHVVESMAEVDKRLMRTQCYGLVQCAFRVLNPRSLLLWLSDSVEPSYLSAMISCQITRDNWIGWGRQLHLSFMNWGLYLAIVCHRDNLPWLWCYVLLSQLTGLAWPQSMLFIAKTLPQRRRQASSKLSIEVKEQHATTKGRQVREWWFRWIANPSQRWTTKPQNWMPHPDFYLLIFTVNLVVIACINEIFDEDISFYLALFSRFLSFLPLFLAYMLPECWGITYSDQRSAIIAGSRLFRIVYVCCLFLDSRKYLVGVISGSFYGLKAATSLPRMSAAQRQSLHPMEKILGPSKTRKDILFDSINLSIPQNIESLTRLSQSLYLDVWFAQKGLFAWAFVRLLDVGSMLSVRAPQPPRFSIGWVFIAMATVYDDSIMACVLRLGGLTAVVLGAELYTA